MARTKYKVTCNSGKIVVLSKLTIALKNQAIQIASMKLPKDTSQAVFQAQMSDELLRLLLIEINGNKVDPVARENLDSLFEFGEYMELSEIMGDMIGVGEGKKKALVETIMEE